MTKSKGKVQKRKPRHSMDNMVRFFDDCNINIPLTADFDAFKDACWVWKGGKAGTGMPMLRTREAAYSARQWIYKQLYPEVIHQAPRRVRLVCADQFRCVNPFHMEQIPKIWNTKREKNPTPLEYPESSPRHLTLYTVWRAHAQQLDFTIRSRSSQAGHEEGEEAERLGGPEGPRVQLRPSEQGEGVAAQATAQPRSA